MKVFVLTWIVFTLATAAHAEICDVVPLSLDTRPSGFTIALPDNRMLMVAAVDEISNEQRRAAVSVFWNKAPASTDLKNAVRDFLKAKAAILAEDQALRNELQTRLQNKELSYVAIPGDRTHLAVWRGVAAQLYGLTFSLAQSGQYSQDEMDQLFLLTVGAPLQLLEMQPGLFENVKLVGIDPGRLNARPQDANAAAHAEASAKAENMSKALEKRFSHNRQTLRQFRRLQAQFRKRVPKGSDREIKERAVAHFWRPARAQIARWVQLQLDAARASGTPSSPPSGPDPLWQQLNAQAGNGLLVINRNFLESVQSRLKQACAYSK